MQRIGPDWAPPPPRVRAFVTTRAAGDMSAGLPGRAALRALLPAEPAWLRQVHGTHVIDAAEARDGAAPEADAAVARSPGAVCAILVADCMPVLLADQQGGAVALAHAGWRGLAAGVIEATLAALGVAPGRLLAWLGPAIGPRAYEVGPEVRAAFVAHDAAAARAFAPGRGDRLMADLYALARLRLAAAGVERVTGGGFCTCSEPERFFSWRRDRARERMAAVAWIES